MKRVKKWFEAGVQMNWHKVDSETTRRRNALKAHKGDKLATARALQALSNVQSGKYGDPETSRKARNDARYFFQKHKKEKR